MKTEGKEREREKGKRGEEQKASKISELTVSSFLHVVLEICVVLRLILKRLSLANELP
mgnify:CR=1 FL=1